MTRDDALARVAKGAALLDRERPGWAQRIDTGRLCLSNGCMCILGQLEGDFFAAAARLYGFTLGYDAVVIDAISRVASVYGFHVGYYGQGPDVYEGYQLLQDAWIAEIAARVIPAEAANAVEPCDRSEVTV